jgi:hypothetical protein
MPALYSKVLVIILLVIGESLSIYAEMMGVRNNHLASQPILRIFLLMFLLITIAGGFLIAGYMLGFNAFKNIWIVSAVSITSILIVEPILAWTIFQQLPTTGAVIGLVLGVTGLIASLY